MFAFLRRFARLLLRILGFLLIALFVWWAGPYFAVADYHPLESELSRLIVIAMLAAFWLGMIVARRVRAYRASDRLAAAVIAQPAPEKEQVSPEAAKLRERFEDAVATLKQQRKSGHNLYDLPWYVIIGAPGSGKTTALINSGLKFPLESRVGRGALKGVGGTRNCDWWFTDEAIFLDTAGRYTTQDSDASSDAAGWAEFLALLRKYRKRRPVNGVILTISASDLITQGDAGREAHVDAARRRLIELNKELRIQLPIYLMVTKCDLVAGFTEYFDDLTHEGRARAAPPRGARRRAHRLTPVGERWTHPPVVAREEPPAWRARWRYRVVALLLLALLVAGAVQLFRVLSGATAQDPGVEAAGAVASVEGPAAGV
jgi:type VI secretion system protein ImpL